MNEAHKKIAKILKINPEIILDLDKKMAGLTGKTDIIDKVISENESLTQEVLIKMGLSKNDKDMAVYGALTKKLIDADKALYDYLGRPDLSQMSKMCGKLCQTAFEANNPGKGFFIKKEKAVEMLNKFPPQNLLTHFGYSTASELVEKEGFSSVFSALRFAQNKEWMHKFFDEAYSDLAESDFEEREVELKVLESQWFGVAEKFLEKKYHNVSHLKEFGVIFIIPLKIDTPGETLRMFTLLLHYLNEVPFYSKLFRKFSKEPDFSANLKSLLRGDVMETEDAELKSKKGEFDWLIIQRYLAKDNENDPRLLMPHINPEAEHWHKAELSLANLNKLSGLDGLMFDYWHKIDFAGVFFKDGLEKENEFLVSFDLIDLVMSLVKKGEIKYLYHQQEALWNKIFLEYLGREKMNELIEKNIINGFICFHSAKA